jgi:hypothetical protein
MALTKTPIELSSTPGIVDNSNATAITIDSSERVLIGKTATGLGASGTEINPNGYIQVTEDQSPPLYLNRLSTDGSIVNFYKDGTTVGSIGVRAGVALSIDCTTSDFAGLDLTSTTILPRKNSALNDGEVVLGEANYRFKDLYLSGGAYLGGTAAANKLDHYEEVAWTPTQAGVTLSVSKARALRVGNLVTLNARIVWPSNNDSTTVALGGLPFPAQSTWEGTGSIMANNAVLDSTRPQLNTYMGGSSINFYKAGSGVQWVALNNASLSGADVIFTLSYLAS